MKTYEFKTQEYKFPYYLVQNDIELIKAFSKVPFSSFAVIFDKNIEENISSFLKYLSKRSTVIKQAVVVNEENKNYSTVSNILELLLQREITRQFCVVAIGGGTLGNIAGLVASMLFRGLPLIHIPTTILSCSDSVLSIKQGVNSSNSKNTIGTFYSPRLVITNYQYLLTLPQREISSGYIELVKNLVTIIPDKISYFKSNDFFSLPIKYEDIDKLIQLSILAKEKVMKNDPYEKKGGIILEYGHSVGHALELLSLGEINHGEGVAIGMLVAGDISKNLNYFNLLNIKTQTDLIRKTGCLTTCLKEKLRNIVVNDLIDLITMDNKRGYINSEGKIAMVILKDFGVPMITNNYCLANIDLNLLKKSITNVLSNMNEGV